MIRLATRGSRLAVRQAEAVRTALARVAPGEPVELVPVPTLGDETQDDGRDVAALGRTNVFTAEVDRAVLDGRADAAVHSLKDLGCTLAGGMVLAAVLERGPVEDVLVSRAGSLRELPAGARVGTGSPRRRAMLLRARPDLACVPLRGNVETRVAKVERGEVDAAILARAGLERLGLARVATEVLPTSAFLPAAGQGLIGVTCRSADARVRGWLTAARHADDFQAALAERALLARLGAGCHACVGALARVAAGRLTLSCRVLARDGESELSSEVGGAPARAEELGAALAAGLLSRGAGALLDPR